MAGKKSKKRLFSGMGYREVQRSNSSRKHQLTKQDRNWLKENGYRNVGWENVIKLYQKINDLLVSSDPDEPDLEALFLKAEKLGNKYQTPEEIEEFNQRLQAEAEAIANTVDRQFPDEEFEFIDYGANVPSKPGFKVFRRRRK